MKNLFLKLAILIACFLNAAIIYSTPINQYISSVTPTQNAVSVNKSSNITIVFTQDMNPATINNANIMVFGYQTGLLPVTIDYNQVNKTANINPNQELKAGEKVSVTLTSGIRTISNSNISPFVYTFYVQAIGGNGIFTSTSSIDNVLNAVIKSGDIDMDGDIDLIVNNRIYLNNGNAGFIFSNELSVSGIPELADFDNDGDIDIAIGDYSGNSVGILLNGDIPLPVELTSFTSETETNNVTLNWTTSSEENNAGYDVERSMFNVQTSMFNDNWIKAGFVSGKDTTGNSNSYTFTDKNLQSGKYKYRLKQSDYNGNFKYYELSNEVVIGVPDKFYLSQNYPNPFNPSTNLGFGISSAAGGLGFVSLKVYDVLGNEVAVLVNETKEPGYYNVQFDGSSLSSGIYFYRLESNGQVQTKRMMMVK